VLTTTGHVIHLQAGKTLADGKHILDHRISTDNLLSETDKETGKVL
jgi:hypothetical protein